MTIPRKELVGQNARLVNGVYSDDFLTALNQFASVNEVFGNHKASIAAGEHYPVAKLVMETIGKAEYENHLVALVMAAAKAGEWRAVKRDERHTSGLDEVTKKHFGHVVKYERQTFLLPSAMYVVYCNEHR